MSKERFLTVMVPIDGSVCEPTVYANEAALIAAVPVSESNINKIYQLKDGTYRRLWYNPENNYALEYHAVEDREFPYLGQPLNIYDFTYDATRMGQAPTITAQAVMLYADKENGEDVTLENLWTMDCHVVFNGEKLYLKRIPTSSKNNEDARYRYDMEFVSEDVVLENVYIYDVVQPFITEKPISENSSFKFYGDAAALADRINSSLLKSGLAGFARKHVLYPGGYVEYVPYLTYKQWNQVSLNRSTLVAQDVFAGGSEEADIFYQEIYQDFTRGDYNYYLEEFIYDTANLTGYQCKIGKDKYGNDITTEEKLIIFDKNYIYDALQEFHNTFGLQYYVEKERAANGTFTGNTIIWVGDCQHDFADWDDDADDYVRDNDGVPTSTNPFDYGVSDALLSKEKTNTTDKIITRITGVGSAENIPWYYPNPNPDGWIKPFLRRLGGVLSDVTIDYPVSEGETTAENVRFEKYLKNRIGNDFSYGVVRDILSSTDCIKVSPAFYTNSVNNLYAFDATYQIASVTVEMLVDEPDDWSTNYNTYYKLNDDGTYGFNENANFKANTYYKITPSVSVPKLTLDMTLNRDSSNLSKFIVQWLSGTNVLQTYDDSQTYESPTAFQSLCMNHNGEEYLQLLHGIYRFKFNFYVTSVPTSRHYDYMGYIIPDETVSKTFPHIDDDGNYHHYYYISVPNYAAPSDTLTISAHTGENFYSQNDGLRTYIHWDDKIHSEYYVGAKLHTVHIITPLEAGWSTEGTYETKIEPILRSEGKHYKDLDTDVIYVCTTSSSSTWGGANVNAFSAATKMTPAEWLENFVNMKLCLYDSDSWYLGDNAVDLADYGINGFGGAAYTPDIFDKIMFQRVKYITPQKNLVPEVYIKTDGERRFYDAHNYYPLQAVPLAGVDDAIGETEVSVGGVDYVHNNIYKENETDPDNEHYTFENVYLQAHPHEHIEDFDDVKPSIKEQTVIVDGQELRIDVVETFEYDTTDNDEIWESNEDGNVSGDYKHPYFFAKLRPLGFNIFDLALQEDMVLSMTTGHCGACNFKIAVDETTKKNTVQIWERDVYLMSNAGTYSKVYDAGDLRRYVDETNLYYYNEEYDIYEPVNKTYGAIDDYPSATPVYQDYAFTEEEVSEGLVGTLKKSSNVHFEGDVKTSGYFIESQQDTSESYVWVVLTKDIDTYGTLMPSARPDYTSATLSVYIRPKSITDVHTSDSTMEEDEDAADKFVFTNIALPQVYLRRAERLLSRKLVAHMYKNNYQKFNFSVKFSRIYIEENSSVDDNLNENSVVYVYFNRRVYRQYIKHYTYRMSHDEALPEISVDTNDELSVTMTVAQRQSRAARMSGNDMRSEINVISERIRDNSRDIQKGTGNTSSPSTKPSSSSSSTVIENTVLVNADWTQTNASAQDYVKNKPQTVVSSGLKIYYNGSDVTGNDALLEMISAAAQHWYGSQDAYDDLVDNNSVQPGMLYHIYVQPDWEETDPSHLGYIKNQPELLDLEVLTEDHVLRFFFTKFNQEI